MSISVLDSEVMDESFVIPSPLGNLFVALDANQVVQLEYGCSRAATNKAMSTQAKKVRRQIEQYFLSADYQFNVELNMQGTSFQKRVWRALTRIPVGQTRTYGQLAKQLKSSARAVGNACRQNPIPLIVPCHRVVAQNGLGGFSGKTTGKPVERKRWLLQHEGAWLL